jgi:Fungal specific transcription factor domain
VDSTQAFEAPKLQSPAGPIREQLNAESPPGAYTEIEERLTTPRSDLTNDFSYQSVHSGLPCEAQSLDQESEMSVSRRIYRQEHNWEYLMSQSESMTVMSSPKQTISRIPKVIPSLVDGIDTRVERRIFHHYVTVVSRALTLNNVEDKNPFTTLLIPLALADRGLLRLMLSCSASHLNRVQLCDGIESDNAEVQQISEAKWRFYGDALKIYSERIGPITSAQSVRSNFSQKSDEDAEKTDLDAALAMTMFMCQFDTCESGRDGIWRLHLNAAREIVRLRYENTYPTNLSPGISFDGAHELQARRNIILENSVSQFLLDWYFYHDVMASITDPEKLPSLDIHSYNINAYGATLRSTPLARYYNRPKSSEIIIIDPHEGFLHLIARIMNLRQRLKDRNSLELTPIDTFQDLDAEILDAGIAIAEELRTRSFSYCTREQEIVAECDRWAAFILLYATIHPTKGRCPEIQSALEEGLFYLEQLFPTENAQTCFIFPIFVFGVTAVETVHCQTVKTALDAYNAWSSLGNVEEVKKFLTQKWDQPQNFNDSWWAWEKEMKDQACFLVLV